MVSQTGHCFSLKLHVVDHREQSCLNDAAAIVSFMSRSLVKGPARPCALNARGVDGEELRVLGRKEIPLTIGNEDITDSFLVLAKTILLHAVKIVGHVAS